MNNLSIETKSSLDMMDYVAMEKQKLSDRIVDKKKEIKQSQLNYFARTWKVTVDTILKAILETQCRVICVIESWLREHGFMQ